MPLSASTPSLAKARVIGAMTMRFAKVQPLIVIGVNSGPTSIILRSASGETSDGRDRRSRRADRAGEAQRRGGQQKGVTLHLLEMPREIAQPPQLAQIDAELEQAALMQRQQSVGARLQIGAESLHRLIVGAERDDAAVL